MKVSISGLVLSCALLGLAACSTAPVVTEPEQPEQGQEPTPYDTRGSDVYTYQLEGSDSGSAGGSASSSAGYADPASGGNPTRGPVTGGPAASSAERTIYFEYDSAEIPAEARPVIEAHARFLIDNPAATVTLEGHADERGTREYNIALGERRADAVRRLMNAFGVVPTRIRVVSYGEERPAVLSHDEAGYARNRRVEIVY